MVHSTTRVVLHGSLIAQAFFFLSLSYCKQEPKLLCLQSCCGFFNRKNLQFGDSNIGVTNYNKATSDAPKSERKLTCERPFALHQGDAKIFENYSPLLVKVASSWCFRGLFKLLKEGVVMNELETQWVPLSSVRRRANTRFMLPFGTLFKPL